MTLFSYHKYNDFILIQEIYTQKYTACTKDEANRIADDHLQADGTSYANGLAQADRCDCPEPTKTWSANVVDYSESGSCIDFTVEYSNPCNSSKTITVIGGAEANTSAGMEMTTSTTVTIGTGNGSTGGRMCFQAGIKPGTAHAACTTGGQC